MAALSAVSPEVAYWLRDTVEIEEGFGANHTRTGASEPRSSPLTDGFDPKPGGITVVLGGGLLDEVWDFLGRMPPGHQLFVLEPRADVIGQGLGRFDLGDSLSQENLVILGPSDSAMEQALSRHPQLGLAENVDFFHLSDVQSDPRASSAIARLQRLLGHALKARDLALKWEEPRGVNLISNLSLVPLMGSAAELMGCLKGRPAVLMEAGASLGPALERLAGHLAGAVVMVSDQALPQVMEAGITPSAVASTIPGIGRLSCYSHNLLERVPLIAEDVAHAPTLRAHPGPRFICLGARGTALPPLDYLAQHFTPQHHTLGRMAEVALFMGCRKLILVGADLDGGPDGLTMPSMNGGQVITGLDQAAAACSFGQVMARAGVIALNTAIQGLGLPGARTTDLDEVLSLTGSPGQPLIIEPLREDRWLSAKDLEDFARGLRAAAAAANRLWQRAAAPLADYPPEPASTALPWLTAADALYVALAEQAAADRLQAAFLEGCLVRAFLRRHRIICQGRNHGAGVDEACTGLGACLKDLEARAYELAQGLKETAAEFSTLAQALRRGDQDIPGEFARQMGRPRPNPNQV